MTQRSMSVRVRSAGQGDRDSTAQSSLRAPGRLRAPTKALPAKQPLPKRMESKLRPARSTLKSPTKRLAAYRAMTSAPASSSPPGYGKHTCSTAPGTMHAWVKGLSTCGLCTP